SYSRVGSAFRPTSQDTLAPAGFEMPALDPGQNPRSMAPGHFCHEPLPDLGLRPRLGRTRVAGAETLDGAGGRWPKPGFALRKPFWEARRNADRVVGGPGHGGFTVIIYLTNQHVLGILNPWH